jgi:photosynthetic reaction center H subunit
MTGSIIGTIDVAQVVMVIFIGFVLALFVYLRREDKREGYPLIDPAGGRDLVGFPLPPPPKHFVLVHEPEGTTMPHPEGRTNLPMSPLTRAPGSPFVPNGDPVQDGIGAASWAMKRDEPILTWEGDPQLQPLRKLPGWDVDPTDPDPRGWPVRDAQGVQVGTVVDLWLDHGVKILRYLEVEVTLPNAVPRAMIPIYFAETSPRTPEIWVLALDASHFAAFPQIQHPDQITAREEDRVSSFCAGGQLYGRKQREEKRT